ETFVNQTAARGKTIDRGSSVEREKFTRSVQSRHEQRLVERSAMGITVNTFARVIRMKCHNPVEPTCPQFRLNAAYFDLWGIPPELAVKIFASVIVASPQRVTAGIHNRENIQLVTRRAIRFSR